MREVEVVRKIISIKIVWFKGEHLYRVNYIFVGLIIFHFFFSFFWGGSFVQRGKNIFGRKLNVITEKRSVSCSLYIK